MKIPFHCVNSLTGRHNKDIELTNLILWPWPTCCGADMRPIDEAEWRRISKALGRANIELQQIGQSLAGLLFHTEGRIDEVERLRSLQPYDPVLGRRVT